LAVAAKPSMVTAMDPSRTLICSHATSTRSAWKYMRGSTSITGMAPGSWRAGPRW
jgi:hypothetical protein